MRSVASAVAGAFVLGACAMGCGPGITWLAYTPNPDRITDPATEAKALVESNTIDGCITDAQLMPAQQVFVVKYVCGGATGNQVAHLDDVSYIVLQQSGEWYRILVHHKSGDDFGWTSKRRGDMERLGDALTAIATPDSKARISSFRSKT
jgi:hypothetical protein